MRKLLLLLPLLLFAIIGCSENPTGIDPVEIVETVEGSWTGAGIPTDDIIMVPEDKHLSKTAATSGTVAVRVRINNGTNTVGIGGLCIHLISKNGITTPGILDANGWFRTKNVLQYPVLLKVYMQDNVGRAVRYIYNDGKVPVYWYYNISSAVTYDVMFNTSSNVQDILWAEAMLNVYNINQMYKTVPINAKPNLNSGRVGIEVKEVPYAEDFYAYRPDLGRILIHYGRDYYDTYPLIEKLRKVSFQLGHEYGGHYYQWMYVFTPQVYGVRWDAVDESHAEAMSHIVGVARYPGRHRDFDLGQMNNPYNTTLMTDMYDVVNNKLLFPGVVAGPEFAPNDVISGYTFAFIHAFMRARTQYEVPTLGQWRTHLRNSPKPVGVTSAMLEEYWSQIPEEWFTHKNRRTDP